MKIQWNKVTWYSKVAALIIYVGTFALAFYLGRMYEATHPDYVFMQQEVPVGGQPGW